MESIGNEKRIGRVVDVEVKTSKAGNRMVVIEWDVANLPRRLKSYHVTADAADVRNERNIRTLRGVFTAWDGKDTAWFAENYDECLAASAELVIADENWNGRTYPTVKYVNPLRSGLQAMMAPPKRLPPPTRPQGTLPEEIEPTLEGVWNAYVALHCGESYPELTKGWFVLLDGAVVPQKDQDQYDEFDWRTVIAAMKNGKEAA